MESLQPLQNTTDVWVNRPKGINMAGPAHPSTLAAVSAIVAVGTAGEPDARVPRLSVGPVLALRAV